MANPLRELLRRRVPQFLGLYLGASWGVVQFVDWLAKRYLLPNALTDGFLLALASLAPAMFLLAWGHGAPGRDPWGRTERIGVPANVVLTLVLLGTFLYGRDLGATAQRVTVTDEDGQSIERLVPKQGQRRRMVLFVWENGSHETDLDWLRYGVPLLLEQDLEQDPYLEVWTPFDGWEGSIITRLQRAGFDDGLGVPVALQRRLAESWHLEYFADGRLDRVEGDIDLRLDLYRVEPAATVAELRAVGPELLPLIDQLTELLKTALEVPAGSARLADDLPVADHMSTSLDALRRYVEGQTALLLGNDREAAIDHFGAAVEHDPSFALAQSEQGRMYSEMGATGKALELAQQALRNDYKLPERNRFQLKAESYWLAGETDKAIALYEMWVDLYPDDSVALSTLANQYQWSGNRIEDSIATYERLLVVDPSQDWVLTQLGRLWGVKGEPTKAREYFERYADLHPDESGSWIRLANWHIRQGELDTARELFEKAELLISDSISPLISLADVDLRQGDLDAVEARLEQAAQRANDDRSRSMVAEARLELLEMRGRLREYVDLLAEVEEIQARYRRPTNVLVETMILHTERWVEAGLGAEAATRLDALAADLEPPFDRLVAYGRMLLHLAQGDVEAAQPWMLDFERFINSYNRPDLLTYSATGRGRSELLRGRPRAAVQHFRSALEAFDRSPQSAYQDWPRLRLLTDLGRALRLSGEGREARQRLEEILRIFPAYPWAHLELALLAEEQRQLDVARDHLDRVFLFWEGADEEYPPAREGHALAGRLTRQGLRAKG